MPIDHEADFGSPSSAEISFETLPTPMPMDHYDSDSGHLPPIADPSPSDEEEDGILPQPTELSDTEDIPSDRPAWSTVDGGSQKRKEKLLDGLGYVFSRKNTSGDTTYWRCSVRNKNRVCPPTAIQRKDIFTRGQNDHNHEKRDGLDLKVKVTAKAKKVARENIHRSAGTIVKELIDDSNAKANLPPLNCTTRAANRAREDLRPKHPKDLDFVLNESHLPDNFLVSDLRVDRNRHVILATEEQLRCLAQAKTWYLDGTFKAAKAPFTQLYSIHKFLTCDGKKKQVPCVFILMSWKRARDYKEVFRTVRDALLQRKLQIHLQKAVMDFESAVWKAIRSVFAHAKTCGCAFHWGQGRQAVEKHVGALGLKKKRKEEPGMKDVIRRLLALQYLPSEHIELVFRRIKEQTKVTQAFAQLFDYIEDTWVTSRTFPPRDWSCFARTIRTNNDVEGWHKLLNKRCRDFCLEIKD